MGADGLAIKSTCFVNWQSSEVFLALTIKLYASRTSLYRWRQRVFTRRARCVGGAFGRYRAKDRFRGRLGREVSLAVFEGWLPMPSPHMDRRRNMEHRTAPVRATICALPPEEMVEKGEDFCNQVSCSLLVRPRLLTRGLWG